jgi:undecaprenyl diphosphate synthase|tara:strand:+ start:741 stop:1466 length:726 start_codon:yes stop_codon:yes gene_type:complete
MANLIKQNNNLPKNVGIIMDGNGRWAVKNSFKVSEGHKKGVNVVRKVVEESVKQDIKSLTLYAFSSENWKRPKTEINAIKKLIIKAIDDQSQELIEQKVKLKFFGDIDSFGKKIINKISKIESDTYRKDSSLDLNVALGYGGQQDIINIVKNASKQVSSGKLNVRDINKKTIETFSSVPVEDIDLLIRTGGDKRVSNFLLFQIAYAEIMFIDKFWPDFTVKDYKNCLNSFKKVSRRFGKRI